MPLHKGLESLFLIAGKEDNLRGCCAELLDTQGSGDLFTKLLGALVELEQREAPKVSLKVTLKLANLLRLLAAEMSTISPSDMERLETSIGAYRRYTPADSFNGVLDTEDFCTADLQRASALLSVVAAQGSVDALLWLGNFSRGLPAGDVRIEDRLFQRLTSILTKYARDSKHDPIRREEEDVAALVRILLHPVPTGGDAISLADDFGRLDQINNAEHVCARTLLLLSSSRRAQDAAENLAGNEHVRHDTRDQLLANLLPLPHNAEAMQKRSFGSWRNVKKLRELISSGDKEVALRAIKYLAVCFPDSTLDLLLDNRFHSAVLSTLMEYQVSCKALTDSLENNYHERSGEIGRRGMANRALVALDPNWNPLA